MISISLWRRQVRNRQRNKVLPAALERQAAGFERHFPAAQAREIMLDHEVLQAGVLRTNFLQQRAQLWNIPLVVAQRMDAVVERLRGADVEVALERLIGRAELR